MARPYRILTINPGSTSTKLGCFHDEAKVIETSLHHSERDLARFPSVIEQEEFRHRLVAGFVEENFPDGLDAVAGRGGILRPLESGVYEVNEAMLADLRSARFGSHPSNLGAILAKRTAEEHTAKAFVVDPPVVDELEPASRLTGLPNIHRQSIFHALNQKEAARRFARSKGLDYNSVDLIVCHLGGGISVGVHRKGRVVWVNDALSGEGPFTPERAGTLASLKVLEMALSGKFDRSELRRMMLGRGGLVAHLGTNDIRRAVEMDDEYARLVVGAMALQVAREITAGLAVLGNSPEAIIITGNAAHCTPFVSMLQERISAFSNVVVMPGSFENEALAAGVLRVLRGEEHPKHYQSPLD